MNEESRAQSGLNNDRRGPLMMAMAGGVDAEPLRGRSLLEVHDLNVSFPPKNNSEKQIIHSLS